MKNTFKFTIDQLVKLAKNAGLFRRHFPLRVGAVLSHEGKKFTVCEFLRVGNYDTISIVCRGVYEDGKQASLELGSFGEVVSTGNGVPDTRYNAFVLEAAFRHFVRMNLDGTWEGTGYFLVLNKVLDLGLKSVLGLDPSKVENAFKKGQVPGVLATKSSGNQSEAQSYLVDEKKFTSWLKKNYTRLLKRRDSAWFVVPGTLSSTVDERLFSLFGPMDPKKKWKQSKRFVLYAMISAVTEKLLIPKYQEFEEPRKEKRYFIVGHTGHATSKALAEILASRGGEVIIPREELGFEIEKPLYSEPQLQKLKRFVDDKKSASRRVLTPPFWKGKQW